MESIASTSHRLIHIDLKGAPPKPAYFEKFFPFIKSYGATGILLEWEDTFPYTKELLQIGGLSDSAKATGAPYSIEEAKQILDLASDSDLLVIPLVQTFGHMEYVLKHDEWRHLREMEKYPSSMCPSNGETMRLVRSMVKQIIAFHSDIKYIHIGADEIWHMGRCAACVKRAESSKYGNNCLYLEHVTEVAQFIKENYPTLKIIIWDDMLRKIDLKTLQDFNVGNLVEPMVWHYNASEYFTLAAPLWDKYCDVFKYIWFASAFKGATSSCQIIPVIKYHTSNHEGWLKQLEQYGNKILNFRGIVLTGWSRFDHYAALCELLPCSLPSLCFCMKTWLSGGLNQEMQQSLNEKLGFPEGCLVEFLKKSSESQLNFPESKIYLGMNWFCSVRSKYHAVINCDQMQTWCNAWQISNNYTNPMQIDTIVPHVSQLLLEVYASSCYMRTPLENTFYPHTIEEIQGTLYTPIIKHLQQIQGDCDAQLLLGCRVRGKKKNDDISTIL